MTLRLRDIRVITFASSELLVTDRSTGDFDTVTNVETLSFADDIAVSHDGTDLVLTGQSTDNIEVVGSVGVTVLVGRVMVLLVVMALTP